MQPTANRAHCFRGVESGAVASHTIFVRVEPCSRTSASIFLALVVFHMGEGHSGCDHRGKPWTATRFCVGGHLFRFDIFRCHWQGLKHGTAAHCQSSALFSWRRVGRGGVTIFVRVEPCSRTSASIFLALVVFHIIGENHGRRHATCVGTFFGSSVPLARFDARTQGCELPHAAHRQSSALFSWRRVGRGGVPYDIRSS